MKERSARRVLAAGVEPGEGGLVYRLDEATAHKLRDVLRLGPADLVTVVDAAGIARNCRVVSLEPGQARAVEDLASGEPMRALPEPWPLTLGLAVLKGERMEWAIEKASEIGVASLLPILCQRSVAREVGEGKRDRWRRVAEAATLQCARARPLAILPVAPSLEAALAALPDTASCRIWYGLPGAPRMVEEGGKERIDPTPPPELVLVGPEGGWTTDEEALLARSAHGIDLGPFTLRSETAAIAISLLAIQSISIKSK